MKLLVVEDEKTLASLIIKGLKKLGYGADGASDGLEALEMLAINQYDLMILDLNLPKLDGLEVLKQVRAKDCNLKVLILSARNQIEAKIMGLDLGANDYLEKPFDFGELAARIRNLLRWSFQQKEANLVFGCLEINILSKEVFVAGNSVKLTKKEYGILEYFAYNQGRVISAEELIEHIWDGEIDLFSNSFKFHLHSLKKKLAVEDLIINLRGQGYVLNEKFNKKIDKTEDEPHNF